MRRIFASIGDAVIVTDQDIRISQMNSVAEDLTGWSAVEARGQLLGNVFHIVNDQTHETLESPADKVKRLGTIAGGTKHAVLLGKSGRETHIDDSGAPIWDDAGALSGIVVVFRNIDQRRQADREREQLLRELERGYTEIKAIYETSSIALAVIDPINFHYLRGNAKLAQMLNQPIDKIIGTPVFDLANDVGGLRDALMQAAQGTPVVGRIIEGELATRPGVHRCWQAEYLPVFSSTGVVELIVASSIEITEQRELHAALIQNEKLAAVGRLAASITHEINNPLESVTNLLYLARLSQDIEEIQGYLETAEPELRRVSIISNQTLQFHRHATNPTPVFLSELIESAVLIYQGRIVNTQVMVEQRLRVHNPVACFDGEIRQVLNNLVGNALDAMASTGGRLLIRSREATHWKTGRGGIVLTVADTGGGMKPGTRTKIFDPFFTTKGVGGSGLGLWISCEIVTRHQGSLRVRSSQRQSSHGSVFTIFLPGEATNRG